MQKSHTHNGITLDYYYMQSDKAKHLQEAESMVSSVLFDESHGELLRLSSSGEEDDLDTFAILQKTLTNGWKWKVSSHQYGAGAITAEILEKHDIFVLASPVQQLDEDEAKAILDFVVSGKSVLLIHSGPSLNSYLEENRQFELEDNLLKALGIKFRPLLSCPPDEISKFTPHYLTSEVDLVFLREPSCIEKSESAFANYFASSQIVINSSITGESFLTAFEPGNGRIVVLADHAILSDSYIEYGNNKQLTYNIFRWLGIQNQLDISVGQNQEDIIVGGIGEISISLRNPLGKRLEYISCLLEGDSVIDFFGTQERVIRSIAPFGQTNVQWRFKLNSVGYHVLKLTIDSLKDRKVAPLFFERVAEFQCISDLEIDLSISDSSDSKQAIFETGKAITVKPVFDKRKNNSSYDIHIELSDSVLIAPNPAHSNIQWEITQQKNRYHPISVAIDKTGQKISRLIHVKKSIQDQIREIEWDILAPVEGEVYRKIKSMELGLDIDEISKIPFRIMTSEDYLDCIYGDFPKLHSYVNRVLNSARKEVNKNKPLVKLILEFFCPTYSPKYGCCVPYDPDLASYLAGLHPEYSDNLAQNFLSLDSDDHIWIMQNIAALILHEKYGHGFFFTQTKLGKQMATLFKNGMQRDINPNFMKGPYPRLSYEAYSEIINQLWNSSDLFMEGFATWVEFTVLPHLSPLIAQAKHYRKNFLFSDIDGTYQTGFHFFQTCQNFLKSSGFPNAVVSLTSKIADIDFGITERDDKVSFSIPMNSLDKALGEQFQLDLRLKRISEGLSELENSGETQQSVLKYISESNSLENLIENIVEHMI
jgi:hypothetical protein